MSFQHLSIFAPLRLKTFKVEPKQYCGNICSNNEAKTMAYRLPCRTFYILDFPYRFVGEKYEEDFKY